MQETLLQINLCFAFYNGQVACRCRELEYKMDRAVAAGIGALKIEADLLWKCQSISDS
jgi:hypothetical protein